MDERSSLDPVEEARARVRLRHQRAKPARRPPPPIGFAAARLVRKQTKGKGPAIQRLKDDWREIAGDAFWQVCRPEKITGGAAGRVLTLKVLPAAAVMVQHQIETLRQRVSLAAGGQIEAIKIVQGPLGAAGNARMRRITRPLTPTEQHDLEVGAARITHPALRRAIVALGAAMLTADEPKPVRPAPETLL